MTKAIMLVLAAAVSSMLGVVVFYLIDIHFLPLFAVDELDVLTQCGFIILVAAAGAACGVVMSRAVYARINKPRMQVPLSSEVGLGEVTVPSRKNIRPLTWLYRA